MARTESFLTNKVKELNYQKKFTAYLLYQDMISVNLHVKLQTKAVDNSS